MDDHKAKWEKMTTDERAKFLRQDKSMRSASWDFLVNAMATAPWDALTPVQRQGIIFIFETGGSKRMYRRRR